MELKLLGTKGIPEGSIVSVKVGTLRRQAAIGSGRPYRFADCTHGKQHMKVDVYAPVASARLLIEPREACCSVQLEGTNSAALGKGRLLGVNDMSLDFAVSGSISDPSTDFNDGASELGLPVTRPSSAASVRPESKNAARRHQVALDAQPYFEQHHIMDVMQALLQSVIKEKPVDPYSYMIRVLENTRSAALGAVAEQLEPKCSNYTPVAEQLDSKCPNYTPIAEQLASVTSHTKPPPQPQRQRPASAQARTGPAPKALQSALRPSSAHPSGRSKTENRAVSWNISPRSKTTEACWRPMEGSVLQQRAEVVDEALEAELKAYDMSQSTSPASASQAPVAAEAVGGTATTESGCLVGNQVVSESAEDAELTLFAQKSGLGSGLAQPFAEPQPCAYPQRGSLTCPAASNVEEVRLLVRDTFVERAASGQLEAILAAQLSSPERPSSLANINISSSEQPLSLAAESSSNCQEPGPPSSPPSLLQRTESTAVEPPSSPRDRFEQPSFGPGFHKSSKRWSVAAEPSSSPRDLPELEEEDLMQELELDDVLKAKAQDALLQALGSPKVTAQEALPQAPGGEEDKAFQKDDVSPKNFKLSSALARRQAQIEQDRRHKVEEVVCPAQRQAQIEQDQSQEANEEMLMAKAQDALLQALLGEQEAALAQDPAEDVRLLVKASLQRSCDSGDLQRAMQSVKRVRDEELEKTGPVEVAQASRLTQLRQEAQAVLKSASDDGRLAAALSPGIPPMQEVEAEATLLPGLGLGNSGASQSEEGTGTVGTTDEGLESLRLHLRQAIVTAVENQSVEDLIRRAWEPGENDADVQAPGKRTEDGAMYRHEYQKDLRKEDKLPSPLSTIASEATLRIEAARTDDWHPEVESLRSETVALRDRTEKLESIDRKSVV